MKSVHDSFDRLAAEQLLALQAELADRQNQVRWAGRLRELLQHETYVELVRDLEEVAESVVRRLATRRMDGYQLGLEQGYLRGLRLFANTKPMSLGEESHIRDVIIPELQRKVEEATNLLGNQPQDFHGRQQEWHEGE